MEEITFQEGDSKSFEKLLSEHMDKAVKHYEKELTGIRTGRANTALIENLKVECYGQLMNLKDLATLSAPESRLLVIQPWDQSSISSIEAAVLNSDLGLTPANDGTIIRIQLPQMSASRRDELEKLLGKKTEEAKVGVRNVRKDFHNELREAEKKRIISEDFAKRLSTLMQKVTDQFIDKIDQLCTKKTGEIHQI